MPALPAPGLVLVQAALPLARTASSSASTSRIEARISRKTSPSRQDAVVMKACRERTGPPLMVWVMKACRERTGPPLMVCAIFS
jgi:hypothetical protein